MKLVKTESYFRAASLLKVIIAELRQREETSPEHRAEYEQQIALLFSLYSRFLEMDEVFFRKSAFDRQEDLT